MEFEKYIAKILLDARKTTYGEYCCYKSIEPTDYPVEQMGYHVRTKLFDIEIEGFEPEEYFNNVTEHLHHNCINDTKIKGE